MPIFKVSRSYEQVALVQVGDEIIVTAEDEEEAIRKATDGEGNVSDSSTGHVKYQETIDPINIDSVTKE